MKPLTRYDLVQINPSEGLPYVDIGKVKYGDYYKVFDVEEALRSTSPNKSSIKFPKLAEVWTEVFCRLNKKHLKPDGISRITVEETYNIMVGNS